MEKTISDLTRKASSGDAAAFGEIYSEYRSELYRYALYYLGNRDSAQDAVQDTMLEAFRGIASLKKSTAVKAWLFAILSRTCKHSLREKYAAQLITLDECADIADININSETLQALEIAQLLGKLPPDEKEVVLLSVVCGYKSKEIASLLGCTAGTVRSRLSRSLAKLRKEEQF